MLIGVFLFLYPYNKIKYYEDLLNDLYEYDSIKKKFSFYVPKLEKKNKVEN